MHARTAVIVQARFSSTRLPGKVLESLAGHTVLEHVLHRCGAIASADVVCCAVPANRDSDAVARAAEQLGVVVYRGDEHDVLDRYYRAAQAVDAEVVMRVTSDCPLIDPGICDAVLQLRAQLGADYACNNMPRSGPHGLDCEAFTFAALRRAAHEATDAHSREHVTPWLRSHPQLIRCNLAGDTAGGGPRWTLDYPEDLAFFRALFALLPPWPAIPSTREVLRLLAGHPEIAAINRHLAEGSAGQRPPPIAASDDPHRDFEGP
jgi:spore coat polysaccharide biosynthesis protein SpsF (cytidylyltransferase family)